MVNKKEIEVLNDILLKMSYDVSKTMNENIDVLNKSKHVFNSELKNVIEYAKYFIYEQSATSRIKSNQVDGVSGAAIQTNNDGKIKSRTYINGKYDRFANIRGAYNDYVKTGVIPSTLPQPQGWIEWGPTGFQQYTGARTSPPEPMSIEEFARIYVPQLNMANKLKKDWNELKNSGFDVTFEEYVDLVRKLTPKPITEPKELLSFREFARQNHNYTIDDGFFPDMSSYQDQIDRQKTISQKNLEYDEATARQKIKRKYGFDFDPDNEKESEIANYYRAYLRTNGFYKPNSEIYIGDANGPSNKVAPMLMPFSNTNTSPNFNKDRVFYWYQKVGTDFYTRYNDYQSASREKNKEYELWYNNFGQFEVEEDENNDTMHTILAIGGLVLAAVSIFATYGLSSTVIGGLSISALAGAASLSLTIADAGLYAYEGDTRMAIFVALLGIFDVAQIFKAVKGLKVAQSEITAIREKALDILSGRKIGTSGVDLNKIFTQKELEIVKSLLSPERIAILTGEAKLLGKKTFEIATKEFLDFSKNSAAHFIASLSKLKTYTNLSKLFLVIDGIQWSYNNIYNAITGNDEYYKSMTEMLIYHFLSDDNIQSQIEANNSRIESDLNNNISEQLKTQFMGSISGIDTSGEIKDKESLTSVAERLEQKLSEIKTKYGKLNDNEKKILPGVVVRYYGVTGSVPFKNIEEGNKFREWFNDEYPILSKDIRLDREGSYNNTFIKRAYNIPMGDGRIVGDIYNDYKENQDINKTDEYVGSSSDMG